MMDGSAARPPSASPGGGGRRNDDIEWKHLDKTKFFAIGMSLFIAVRTLVYPGAVIKTRQQVASGSVRPPFLFVPAFPPKNATVEGGLDVVYASGYL